MKQADCSKTKGWIGTVLTNYAKIGMVRYGALCGKIGQQAMAVAEPLEICDRVCHLV